MARPLLRGAPHVAAIAAFGAFAALAGCILAVNDDPSKLHATCTYTGSDSACGKCLADACASALDACCSDSLCSEINLTVVGSCGVGSATCPVDPQYGGTNLASCMNASCAGSCGTSTFVDAGGSGTTGATTCDTVDDSCFCEVGGTPNAVACSASGLKGPGLCCAEYGWPNATGKTCSCQPFSCTPEGSETLCSLGTSSTLTTTASGTCCASTSLCTCESSGDGSDCSTGALSECTVAAIHCVDGDVQVASCSF